MLTVLGVCLLVTGGLAIPPPVNIYYESPPLKDDEYYFNIGRNITHDPRATHVSLKYKYVKEGGIIVDHKPSTPNIEIAATTAVTTDGHYKSALIVSKMVKHMPNVVFERMSSKKARVGVFAYGEKITDFPEFAHHADRPECKGTCSGSCSNTCTFDGRKWDHVNGGTGIRAIVSVENVMCTRHDTHHHHDNIMVHEFGHAVMNYGLDTTRRHLVSTAFGRAKGSETWQIHEYAMANAHEYWAVATGVFFNVEEQRSTSSHMNYCGSQLCSDETAARNNLKTKDPALFDLLSYAYTGRHPEIHGDIVICE